jgi:hypothetical protein
MRVQRTRSSPSALGSPLTRHPLASVTSLWLALGSGMLSPCAGGLARGIPPQQTATATKSDAESSFGVLKSLTGRWSGSVATDPPNPDLDGPP